MSVITPVFRVSYPNVFKPRENTMAKNKDGTAKMEYSLTALFKKGENLDVLKKAAEDAITKKWGSDKTKWPKNLRTPFRKQEDREKDGKLPPGYEEGAVYLNLKSASQPKVVDQNVQQILDSDAFYAGCYAKASINAFAYDTVGNKGVSFGLVNLQKVKDGEPLGSRSRPEDDFSPIEGASDNTSAASDMFG